MNDKKYEVKNDLKLKIFMTKESLKGYKPFITQKGLQKIVNSLYDLYYGTITIDEFGSSLNTQEQIFISSKYHNDDSYYNQDCLYHVIEFNGGKYFIASDGYGNVDRLSIFSLNRMLPQVYDYTNSIDRELSLEGLCHILHSLNVKCSGIEAVVKNHQVEVLIKAYIIDGIIKDLVAKNEDIAEINKFINMLNQEFNMSVIMQESNVRARKRTK